ncbi:TetR family transcriptional regulator [Actinokineospora sp. NBRC 105648]|uniref:TetR/AcrR family transcriptional regulator n=1 Tax=Actinokineospora sp. NBRC 105648 TaxID=3032206 RepID=UPI0024A1D8BD|nr:TetR family transcriptional regulator [Actinokineospora sp. NBRC 105648]GLZ36426.1 TetR family transcriptional regulator [Actinokineospora sp. NBRC 105648]
MATYASVGGRRSRAGLPAVTPERVVRAALALTREHGLENWTLRQLAAGIGAYPAVIYHHVGDREAVVSAVLERVVAELPVPESDRPWRDWFEDLLTGWRPVLLTYPGVARRLAVHGALVPAMHTVIDCAVGVLRRAGLGDESVLACTLLLNQAWQSIAVEDDRGPGIRERAAELHASLRDRPDVPGLAALGRFLDENPDVDLFGYGLARTLDGVAARLES